MYENRFHEVDKQASKSIQPTFQIIRNRKPWNSAAEWLYEQAERLAENAEAEGITTVRQFAARLNVDLGGKVMLGIGTSQTFRNAASNIQIQTWDNDRYAGINKKNSPQGEALLIKLNT